VPDHIARIGDAVLRERALETWEAARSLLNAIDLWYIWLREAAPVGNSLYQQNMARQAVTVLLAHGAAVPSFRGRSAEEVLSWFPEVPCGSINRERDAAFIREVRAKLPRLYDLQSELGEYIDRVVEAPLSALTPGPDGDAETASMTTVDSLLAAMSLQAPETGNPQTKPKRSTEKGEARVKIIPALTKHHQYADGGCLNTEPIGVRELARKADVSADSVTQFFKKEFGEEKGAHTRYKASCRDAALLGAWLKLLNEDYSPHPLFASNPPGEGRDREPEE
jgi:hypothetical protein